MSCESWGREHVLDLKRILARMRLNVTQPFDAFLTDQCRVLSSTDIVLTTAYLNDVILEFVRRKQAEGVRVKLLVLRSLEEGLDYPDDCEIYCLYEQSHHSVAQSA